MAVVSVVDPPVHVTTGARATTMALEYAVIDGRIHVRAKGASGDQGVNDDWRPVDGDDGRPDRQDQPYDFERIARVSADDLGVTAITEQGYLVRYNLVPPEVTDEAARKKYGWDGLWGLPMPGVGVRLPIRLPSSTKSVAHSVRRGSVEYYEDVLGNQFNWGFAGTTSLYVLTEDGRILLGDPWLAPDLSRQVCAPERGTFLAEGLAASASSVMVIGDDGSVFTTFHDYDSNGGTPFINYAYFDRAPRHGLSGSVRISEYEVRALPAEEWTRQPDIRDVDRDARLTRNIAILQNGKGNAARELRVQGMRSSDGATGYWAKQLRDPSWHFVQTGEAIDAETFLDGHAPVRDVRDATGPHAEWQLELAYVGNVFDATVAADVARVDVRNFSFHCSPFFMDLHVKGGGVVSLAIHTADSWTPFAQGDAETDARSYRSMKGTVVVRGLTRPAGDSAAFARVVREFQDVHLETFSYAIIASQRAFEMIPLHRTFGVDPFRASIRARRLRVAAPKEPKEPDPADRFHADADPVVTMRRAIDAVDAARARADHEAREAARAFTIAQSGKVTSGLLNAYAAVSPAPEVAWMKALALHMPAITVTMTRVQAREAEDAAREKDAVVAAVSSAYCAAFARARVSPVESALWDTELLRHCE